MRPIRVACFCACAVIACRRGTGPVPADLDDYRRMRGDLTAAETSFAQQRGRYRLERIRLRSSSGLIATGVLLRPGTGGCFPAVVLQDGREENSNVIGRLPKEFGDVVVLSLDYPSELPYTVRLSDFAFHGGRLRSAARTIPPAFLLGAEYLSHRGDVDATRIAIAATSFAVPFAVIAAAADARFRNVALIYGAGDLPSVLAANLTGVPRPFRRVAAEVTMWPYRDFAPERFIGRIAPRPVVMVNGIDDPQMPAAAASHLYDAAGNPKEMIWLQTGHLMPTDSALIRTLVDTAFSRLSVLRGPPAECTGTKNAPFAEH